MLKTFILTLIVILCLGLYANSWLNRPDKALHDKGGGPYPTRNINQGAIVERYQQDYPQQSYDPALDNSFNLSMQELALERAAINEQIRRQNAEVAANMSQRSQADMQLQQQLRDLQQAQEGPTRAELEGRIERIQYDAEFQQRQSQAARDMEQIQENNRPPQIEYRLPW